MFLTKRGEEMKNAVIFDIDGTLANVDHRRHFVEGKKKDFDAFYEAMPNDAPYDDIIELAILLETKDRDVVICTGRPASYLETTVKWLKSNDVPYSCLMMRPFDRKYDPDWQVKQSMLDELKKVYNITMAIDDRDQVVKMWRDNGIRCLQVADGNF